MCYRDKRERFHLADVQNEMFPIKPLLFLAVVSELLGCCSVAFSAERVRLFSAAPAPSDPNVNSSDLKEADPAAHFGDSGSSPPPGSFPLPLLLLLLLLRVSAPPWLTLNQGAWTH